MRKIILLEITLIFLISLLAPTYAVEQVDPGAGFQLPTSQGSFFNRSTRLITLLISRLLPVALGLAGFLTVIVIVISGIQFASSSGNPEAAAAARGRLTFALVGFGLIILSYAIARIVDRAFLGGSGIFPPGI